MTSNILKSLGAAIKSERKRQNLSQNDIAEAAGVTQGTFSAYEDGRVEIPITSLDKIAGRMGMAIADLFKDEPPARIAPRAEETLKLEAIGLILRAREPDVLIAIDILKRGEAGARPAANKRKPTAG